MHIRLSLFPAAALLLTGVAAHAARTQVHSTSGFEKLADGEPAGLSIVSTGAVVLGPPLQKLAPLEGGPILALTCDAKGTCYVGVTSPGRVLAVDTSGKSRTLLEVEQPLITGLALDGKDGLFVSTAPEGKVHRVDLKTGKSEEYWTPEPKQVWGLAHDGTSLWAVTGEPGALFKVTGKDKATRVAEKALAEKLWRAVAVLPGNRGVVVGSGRKGLVAMLDGKGTAFVQHDSSLEEVTALAVRADGTVAAALVANEGKASGDEALLAASDAGDDDDAVPRDTKNSEVVVISPNGETRRVWRGKKDGAYALAFDDRNGLYIGTGARGRLYRAELDTRAVAIVAQVDSNRVTAMARTPKGLVLGCSHANALLTLSSGLLKEGSYLSPVYDADKQARLGRVEARADVPAGTKVTLQVRSGNSEKPDETWSAWGAAVALPGGAASAPRARFSQVKATLTGDGKATPQLRELHLAHRADNTPPTLTEIAVLAPGVRVEPMPSDEPKGRTFTVSARAFEDFEHKALMSPSPPEPAARAKQTYEAGFRTVTWRATDEDEDELRYQAELFTEAGERVMLLGTLLRDPFISLDESRLPDGNYRVKVTADDLPANALAEAGRAERLSSVFSVDRTPPTVTGKATPAGVVTLAVEDANAVIHAGCSLDGAEVTAGQPGDGLLDGPREDVTVTLPKPGKGHHFVACRAEDAMGNVGRAVFTLETP
jgi:sugar lactone lactonase YvrE